MAIAIYHRCNGTPEPAVALGAGKVVSSPWQRRRELFSVADGAELYMVALEYRRRWHRNILHCEQLRSVRPDVGTLLL